MRWLQKILVAAIAFVTMGVTFADPSLQDLQRQIDELCRIVKEQQQEIERLREQLKRQQPQQPVTQPTVTAPSGERLNFYGFLRLDSIFDSGLVNNAQTPFWVLSPSGNNKGRTGNQQLSIHPRLTRIGINFLAPPNLVKDWNVTGKFEIDWQNAQGVTPESRPLPRIRHAYLLLQHGDYSLLLGQTWDLISPLFPSPNDDTLMWNAGNLGDRRAQIRLNYEPKEKPFRWSIAMGLTGAIDSKDLDKNGVRDGEDSGLPNIQARVAWKLRSGELGLWAHYAWERTTNPVAGQTRFTSQSVGLDYQFRLGNKLDVRGELWMGRNLSDFRGGVGQGVNDLTGAEIRSKGGWLEIGWQYSPKQRLALGYTFDDPRNKDIISGGRTKNSTWYLHHRWRLSGNVDVGINYLFWVTKWQNQATGTDHRFNAFVQHNF
ncbi:hypothetical protein GG496_001489 [Candidatus Fervidibacteria bacterium JGI MDM2 JNZ-1-D12]